LLADLLKPHGPHVLVLVAQQADNHLDEFIARVVGRWHDATDSDYSREAKHYRRVRETHHKGVHGAFHAPYRLHDTAPPLREFGDDPA
jgi:hypothetical protein